MPAPTKPYDLDNNTTADAEQVDANFDSLYSYLQAGVDTYGAKSIAAAAVADNTLTKGQMATAFANGNVEPTFSSYKDIGPSVLSTFYQGDPAGTWLFDGQGGVRPNGTSVSLTVALIPLDPADYAADTRTTKYRVKAFILTNSIAPAVDFTFGLYPVSSNGGVSGAASVTLGTVVAGSTVGWSGLATNGRTYNNSADFTAPAAGIYALAVVTSGTPAAGSFEIIGARLQMRQV